MCEGGREATRRRGRKSRVWEGEEEGVGRVEVESCETGVSAIEMNGDEARRGTHAERTIASSTFATCSLTFVRKLPNVFFPCSANFELCEQDGT